MWETLQMRSDVYGPVIVLCAFAAAYVAAAWIRAWHKGETSKRDAEIKLEMVARGMSADDIVRVLGAKSDDKKLDETLPYTK